MLLRIRYALGGAVRGHYRRSLARFLAATHRTREVQEHVLLEKLARHAASDFGRRYGFSRIGSAADFRRRMPITHYDDYAPYIERVKRGEVGAMFGAGTRLLMFAITSGSTGAAKFIPITNHFLDEYHRGWGVWGIRAFDDHRRLHWSYILNFASPHERFRTEGGVPCGHITGLVAKLQKRIIRMVYCVPAEVAAISEPRAKYYAALRVSLRQRQVGLLMSAAPNTMLQLARLAEEAGEDLVRDIADGTWDARYVPAACVTPAMRRRGRAARRRAFELQRAIDGAGRLRLADAWPNLAMLAVWTGGPMAAYLPALRDHFGAVPLRDHGLSASEGRMTIPLADGSSTGVLDVQSHYFEFIPEDEHDRPRPTVLAAHELQEGRNYYILLTTSSGLYRYDIHDVVRCTGFEGTAPLLEFLNKGAHFSNVAGEKLSEYQVVEAVRRAADELRLRVGEFTLAPEWGDPPAYCLLLEAAGSLVPAGGIAVGPAAPPGMPRLVDRTAGKAGPTLALGAVLDRHLAALNVEYAAKRESHRLGPVRVRQVAAGTWDRLRDQAIAAGEGTLEQHKHRCLVPDTGFLEKVQALSHPIRAAG